MKLSIFNTLRAAAYAVAAGLFVTAAVGCESSSSNDKSLSVSDRSVILDGEGGSQKISVSANGVSWIATAADSWVKVTPQSGTGDSFVVVSAEANNTAEMRTSSITFEAPGVSPVVVSVLQNEGSGSSVSGSGYEVKSVMFAYYGDGLNTGGKLANVAVCLFNQVPDEKTGKFQSYPLKVVELVTSVPFSDNYETACKSVLGHSYKTSTTDKEYTINIANSYYANMISESNTDEKNVVSAELTVSEFNQSNGIVKVSYNVTFDDKSTMSGVFEGDKVFLADYSKAADSTLESDINPVFTSATATIYEMEKVKECALALVDFTGPTSDGQDVLALGVYTDYADLTTLDLSGTYPCIADDADLVPNTFIPGALKDTGDGRVRLIPTIYYHNTSKGVTAYAVPHSGSVVFAKSGENYDVTLNLKDGNGYAISGKYTLKIPATVGKLGTSSASPYSVKVADFARKSNIGVAKLPSVKFERLF